MAFKSKTKLAALILSVTAVFGGTAATAVQVGINSNPGRPFVLLFTNGKNKDANSKYRLLGRQKQRYINRNFNDKLGGWSQWEPDLGLMLDNSNPAVQAEQLNWLYYLLFFNKLRGQKDPQFIASNVSAEQNVKDSTFDGMRIDCADGIDDDILGQTAQLLNNLYDRQDNDANANDHLSFNEGYGPTDVPNERKYFQNSALNYDDSYYKNMTNSIRWYDDDKIPDLNKANSFIANWNDDEDENETDPNLTYSQNHDNFFTKTWDIARFKDPKFSFSNFDPKMQGKEIVDATEDYYKGMTKTDKNIYKGKEKFQVSPKNLVTTYADMLTNKDTVPVVFYGDIFEAEKDYMSTPTAVAQPIMYILNARSKYVSGGEQRKTVDKGHIMTNVRFGKGYFEGKTTSSDEAFKDSQTSGIATIYSNDQNVDVKNLKVYVGKNHAGNWYANLIDTKESSDMGLTYGGAASQKAGQNVMGVENPTLRIKSNGNEKLQADKDGYLTIPEVKGVNKPFVDGYLSMWVPKAASDDQNIYVNETDAKKMNSYKNTGFILNSNAALDSHVLYQDFAVQIPDDDFNGKDKEGNPYKEKDQYSILTQKAQEIADSGITDVWMAPPYVSPDQKRSGSLRDWVARYGYGYMMSDRYNLGEDGTPSKYGTADELISASKAFHKANTLISGRTLKTMVDFVPHQIIRGDKKEEVTFDVYNAHEFGDTLRLSAAHVTQELETKTSDENYQCRFGGKYLKDIRKLFPSIFTTEALSTGETLPADEPITHWSAKYEDAYPLEFGMQSYTDDSNDSNLIFDGYYVSKRH